MDSTLVKHDPAELYRGVVISAATDMAAIQTPEGEMVPADRLGPGIVEQLGRDGRVCVHWVGANFETCLDPGDIEPLGAHAHLVTSKRRDKQGRSRLLKHHIVTDAGLDHNWTAEILPGNTVRIVRSDGAAWTFAFNWVFKRIDVWWPQPPDDEDAEALTVAEIASKDWR